MKMFVWAGPYPVRYGSSMVIAVAETVEAAREEAKRGHAYSYGEFNEPVPHVDLGEPTRIVDLPCAEWHKWSE